MKNQAGLSLVETVIVVAILALTAMVALPTLSTPTPARLDVVAAQVAEAMRFARDESMRLGTPYGMDQVAAGRRIQVFRVDTATTPWSAVFDVYHPVTKKPYHLRFTEPNHPLVAIDSLNRSASYRGTCLSTRERYYFDAQGTPWCLDPKNVLLDWYKVSLTVNGQTRTVTLHGITGRVTVE